MSYKQFLLVGFVCVGKLCLASMMKLSRYFLYVHICLFVLRLPGRLTHSVLFCRGPEERVNVFRVILEKMPTANYNNLRWVSLVTIIDHSAMVLINTGIPTWRISSSWKVNTFSIVLQGT